MLRRPGGFAYVRVFAQSPARDTVLGVADRCLGLTQMEKDAVEKGGLEMLVAMATGRVLFFFSTVERRL